VGINLAIQDAIAAANILVTPLRKGRLTEADLARVQKRRSFPTWATQRLQLAIQNRVIDPVLSGSATLRVPWVVRVMQRLPFLQAIPARLVGLGFRPEHVDLRAIDGR
jgi:2-polyprenyl-6-methoxyphenol hydroxylase-like FAD-dependent oxidoreductase